MPKSRLIDAITPFSPRSGGRTDTPVRSVAVLGLGRFGTALATGLAEMNVDVLGVDLDEHTVHEMDRVLTRCVRADVSRREVLEQLDVASTDVVVVAIGEDLGASVLTCSHLLRMGVQHLWAKAESDAHQQILEQMAVPHVLMPQRVVGARLAHTLVDRAEDWVDYGRGFHTAVFDAPEALFHRTAADAGIRQTYDVRIIARATRAGDWEYVTPQTVFAPQDRLIVAGKRDQLHAFGNLR